jgi:hypothetical protein
MSAQSVAYMSMISLIQKKRYIFRKLDGKYNKLDDSFHTHIHVHKYIYCVFICK